MISKIQAMETLYKQNYRLGFLSSDGITLRQSPSREGKSYAAFTEEAGFSHGWNTKTEFNEFGTHGDILKAMGQEA